MHVLDAPRRKRRSHKRRTGWRAVEQSRLRSSPPPCETVDSPAATHRRLSLRPLLPLPVPLRNPRQTQLPCSASVKGVRRWDEASTSRRALLLAGRGGKPKSPAPRAQWNIEWSARPLEYECRPQPCPP